jgi:RNA polymerase sigma-70 factor, ECF subfamily
MLREMPADREALERTIRDQCEARDYERAATLAVRGYGREILAFLWSRLRDPDAAGEVFSLVVEELWRGLPSFEWRCTLRTWGFMLARHAASRHVSSARRYRRRHVALSKASQLSRAEQRVRTTTLAALRTATKSRIAELRDQLDPKDRDLLVLRVNRQLDWREIARVLLYQGEPLADEALDREAARLRKRFQLVKGRLRKMAEQAGLLGSQSE